ncbi:histidine phosphatase family protein [Streptomyces sp. A7024]|uniref:Histidine phosphatase family protein n=1 Tax=Streptomyces coryli TaxID=1128680 RepID=A0A6G4UDG6_9ACTN|nr:histidine phosphatase family protein [Streptomyces coryli]NGN69716.1 histidine phosphatase family protein [Streptomyces coryli]
MQDRYLYLARHAEAVSEDGGLTAAGRRQAVLLGRRLRDVPLTAVHHGPLPRAAETARIVEEQATGQRLPVRACEAAGDYVPHVPDRAELPADIADALLPRLASISPAERTRGEELARQAEADFTGPVTELELEPGAPRPRHELVVTHAFLVAWLVRAALDAPAWRWMGLNPANAALTVIRYAPTRPASVLVYNDTSHLADELRWTGFPDPLRIA